MTVTQLSHSTLAFIRTCVIQDFTTLVSTLSGIMKYVYLPTFVSERVVNSITSSCDKFVKLLLGYRIDRRCEDVTDADWYRYNIGP